LAACLEERVITPHTKFDCEQGKYKIGGHVVHDTKKHGVLSVSDIIMHSSNIGGIKIGQKLGYANFCEYLRKFGFGSKLGIDLLGEREGFIRPVKKSKPIDQAVLFFGQGMASTSLQLAMAMAAIANGGKLMRPYVVKAIVDESGCVVEETSPKVIRRAVSQKTAKKVGKVLCGVVSDEGTAAQASITGFSVAGKTGTSQKVDPKTKRYSRTKYVATFVGFAPVDQPKLVILVVIDEPKGIHYGGLVAAPVFREVGLCSLNHLRVNPQIRLVEKGMDTPKEAKKRPGSPEVSQIALVLKEGLLPDFRGLGMREVLKKGRSLGLKVLLEGTGVAVKQRPRPGSPLNKVRMVKVSFRSPT
jgi:cell division protein FtsI (penicillin-binding protein 3)